MIPITNDLFDVAKRLLSVNADYRLYYNVAKNRYEVHSAKRGTLQFVVPFDELDARTVDYALKTRVENAEKIFREVEQNNAAAVRALAASAAEKVLEKKENL